ncbi:hypothetical protein RB195_010386 [Necator americanus]|uniref:Uncharacterized protein n=1 Tax=Necator americanus TaxID=51031 RepID=A0ABR1CYZ2_NECAM
MRVGLYNDLRGQADDQLITQPIYTRLNSGDHTFPVEVSNLLRIPTAADLNIEFEYDEENLQRCLLSKNQVEKPRVDFTGT